jgi:protein-L-isoaspartate(D-aspartate) O-methyltransferase
MSYFDYGYFSHSKKTNPKVKQKNIMKNRDVVNKIIANQFDNKYYDGKRINGYGGFKYDERWKIFLPKIIKKYKLNKNSRVLDIGAKKGFFIKDLEDLVPGIKVIGVEDHKYPIKNSLPSVRKKIKYVQYYYDLKYNKNYFDFVHAHNAIYRFTLKEFMKIIKKINYISKKSHITIPTYDNNEERIKFFDWSLHGGIIFRKKEWKKLFKYLKYKGDYYFSGPKSFNL